MIHPVNVAKYWWYYQLYYKQPTTLQPTWCFSRERTEEWFLVLSSSRQVLVSSNCFSRKEERFLKRPASLSLTSILVTRISFSRRTYLTCYGLKGRETVFRGRNSLKDKNNDKGETELVNKGETEIVNKGETDIVNKGETDIVNKGETDIVNKGETDIWI